MRISSLSILFKISLVLFLLISALFTSCERDPCEDIYCYNGYCSDGRCICEEGYAGEFCEDCVKVTYDCLGGTCIERACFYGDYLTLAECQQACGSTGNSGYNCVSGNCVYVSSGAQYSSFSVCQGYCSGGGGGGGSGGGGGGSQPTITFVNNAFTEMTIRFNGISKTANSQGGVATFSGSPNQYSTGTAYTYGTRSNGDQVGLRLDWDLAAQFPSQGDTRIDVNVSSDYFFLKMSNISGQLLGPLYVNYGLQSQTVDNIGLPSDGITYDIGYYRYWSNSNVRIVNANNQSQYWQWGPPLTVWSGPPNILVSVRAI